MDRYKHYLVDFRQTRSVLASKHQLNSIKIIYKKILVNSLYLKRHNVNLYKPLKKFTYSNLFLYNVNIRLKKFYKGDKRIFFF